MTLAEVTETGAGGSRRGSCWDSGPRVSSQPSYLAPAVARMHLLLAPPVLSTSRSWPGLCLCLITPTPSSSRPAHAHTLINAHTCTRRHTQHWCGGGSPLDRGSEGSAHEQCSFVHPAWGLARGVLGGGHRVSRAQGPGPGAERSALPSVQRGRNTQHQEELGHLWQKAWGLLPSQRSGSLAPTSGGSGHRAGRPLCPEKPICYFKRRPSNSFP